MIRIDAEDIEPLAIYNAERRRGLLHTDIYNRAMAHLQECYDQMIAELADVEEEPAE
jgi:hypothetical protein